MRVLVTGGLGMVGAAVVYELQDAGHEPVVLDNHEASAARYQLRAGTECHVGDVLDVDLLTRLLGEVDAVAHLAALLPAESNPYVGYHVNAIGPVTMFEAARRAGVSRVVWSSAKAAYGELTGRYGYPEYEPVPETHPLAVMPWSPVYTASKILAESAASYFATTYALEIVGLRFATIFGPWKVAPFATSLFGAVVASAVGGPPVAIAQGSDERDGLIYVRDAARAVRSALEAPQPLRDVYNIGSDILVSFDELAAVVRAEVAEPSLTVGPGLDPCGIGPMYGRLDDTLARDELGYEPVWDLPTAVRDFAAHLATDRGAGGSRPT